MHAEMLRSQFGIGNYRRWGASVSRMKVLHLYSNWKWTGPAEHALNLARCQQQDGHDVSFACAAPPADATESIVASARRAGIEPVTAFALHKHFRLGANLSN